MISLEKFKHNTPDILNAELRQVIIYPFAKLTYPLPGINHQLFPESLTIHAPTLCGAAWLFLSDIPWQHPA